MGGVPVLLMMAAVGITYGWQPDNKGGVEYVIQIPPDQLHELERIGEITSLVDPAVQGHVSRVVIKVGNSDLPRIAPPNLARAKKQRVDGVIAASDYSPVPIPEMDDSPQAIPIPSLEATASSLKTAGPRSLDPATGRNDSNHAAVMKPDSNDPNNASGFSFPSIPPSLSGSSTQATTGGRPSVDRAGRDIVPGTPTQFQSGNTAGAAGNVPGSGAAGTGSGILVPPPSTRSPQFAASPQGSQFNSQQAPQFTSPQTPQFSSQQAPQFSSQQAPQLSSQQAPQLSSQQAPQFTGSDVARVRTGGPSTEPTNSRDNSWSNFAAGGAPTEMVGPRRPSSTNPFDTRATQTQANPGNPPTSRTSATGLIPSDTFARTPNGPTFSTTRDNPAQAYPDRNAPQQRSASTNQNTTASTNPFSPSPNPFPQGSGRSPYEQSQRDRRSPYAGSNQADRSPYGVTPNGQQTSSDALARGSAGTYNPTYDYPDGRNPQTSPTRQMAPDSRLTRAQVAAGAWSFDDRGRPVDQQGHLLEIPSTILGTVAYDPRLQNGRYSDPSQSSLGQPNTSRPASPTTFGPILQDPRRQPSFAQSQTPASSADVNFVRETSQANSGETLRRSELPPRNTAVDTHGDPPSLTTRRNASLGGTAIQSGKPVAAQPLFNGLLLISFVANVYLIFWMKNLRVQFHDLVAAKRMANTNNPST